MKVPSMFFEGTLTPGTSQRIMFGCCENSYGHGISVQTSAAVPAAPGLLGYNSLSEFITVDLPALT